MDLNDVKGAHFLLNTCADTLEALRIHSGVRFPLLGPPEPMLRDLDLSNSRSLRSLEIPVRSFPRDDSFGGLSSFRDLLSAIISPVFSEVVIVLEDRDILDADFFQYTLFRVVRDMYKVKPFRLVFCLEVWDGDLEEATRRLKWYIGMEATRGGLEFLPCSPVIVSDTQTLQFVGFHGCFDVSHAL